MKRLSSAVFFRIAVQMIFCTTWITTPTTAEEFNVGHGDVSGQTQKTRLLVAEVQPELYNQIMISLAGNSDAQQFALTHGLTVAYQFAGVENTWLFNTASVASATKLSTTLPGTAGVNWAFQNRSVAYELCDFVPDDPFFNNPPPPNDYGGQWHLGNNLNGLPHVNIANAWTQNVTGAGAMIGIVDTGIEPEHEDLSPNFSANNTYDFFINSPMQNLLDIDVHGTLVAGVAAARGGNGIGVTGSAPYSGVCSLKVFQGNQVASSDGFVNAILFNSTGPNPSIHIKNHSYSYRIPYRETPGEVAAVELTAESGTVHVFAAGNDRGGLGADVNTKHLQSSPHQITVAALDSNGQFASYSNFGASIFVTAPSHSWTPGTLWITTTDRTGALGLNQNGTSDYSNTNYTSGMGGTSSSAPLVAGIMALGKQVNPNLDVRLAKHALARSSFKVDPADATATSDGGWRTNAGGFSFNQNYGFGLIDASAFVDIVANYEVTPSAVATSGNINVETAIPDNDSAGISFDVFNGTEGLLEEVLVNLHITHTWRGDVEAYLTSPSGYTSRVLFRNQLDDGDSIDWTFSTNAFWGEQVTGTWSLNVRDVFAWDTGNLNSFSIDWRLGTVGVAGVCADSGSLLEGSGQIGDISASCDSDDSYWAAHGETFAFQLTDPVTQFELVATSTAGLGIGTITVDIEASKDSNNANLNLRALLFNFATGSYVSMPGVMALTTTDQLQTFELPAGSDPVDFVEPISNEVRLLLQTIQTSGLPNVRTQLDDVLFNLE